MKSLQTWFISAAVLVIASADLASAAQLLFTPRVSVTEEYNDNIGLDRKDKKDDFITIVSVGGTLEWLGQISGLRVSYDPGYAFYADNDNYDSWRHNLNGAAWHNFSRETRLDLTNYFLYSKDPLDDRDVEDEQGNIALQGNNRGQTQQTFWRKTAIVRLSHQLGL